MKAEVLSRRLLGWIPSTVNGFRSFSNTSEEDDDEEEEEVEVGGDGLQVGRVTRGNCMRGGNAGG